jgi:hypothetical protein
MGINFGWLMNTSTTGNSQMTFQKDLTIPFDLLAGQFVSDLDVNTNGYIAVAVNDASMIQVFSPQGNLVRNFGQAGRCPGDFTNLMSVYFGENFIHGLDAGPIGKINVFSLNGDQDPLTVGIPTISGKAVTKFVASSEETYLIEYTSMVSNANTQQKRSSSYHIINRLNPQEKLHLYTGQANESFIFRNDSGFTVTEMPFGRKNNLISYNNSILHGWSGSSYLSSYSLSGEANGIIELNGLVTELQLTDEDYASYYRSLLGVGSQEDINNLLRSSAVDPMLRMHLLIVSAINDSRSQLHHFFPYYNAILSCGKYLWLMIPNENRGLQTIIKMESSGKVISEGILPSNITVKNISNDALYGLSESDDGTIEIVRYQITSGT